MLNRRQFLKLASGGLTAAALGACAAPPARELATQSQPPPASATLAPAGARPFEGRTLTMFVYAGLTEKTYREVFAPAFEALTGATIELLPGWWDAAAKLKSAPDDQPPYDLVQTDPTQGFPGIRDNLFKRLDLSQVPNAKTFASGILDTWIYKDGWGIPFLSSAMTLGWNKDLVPGGLKTWKDLFSDSLKGKITLYNAYYLSLMAFAAAKADLDGKPGTAKQLIERDLDSVLQFAKDKSEWVKYWWPTTADGINALLQKNVHAGALHGNGFITPVSDGKPLDFVVPPSDRAYVQLFFLVPRTSRNQDLALAALNYFASAENQLAFGLKTGQLAVNIPSAAQAVAKQQPVWAKVYPSSADAFNSISY